jgi:hypothetical protein
MSNATVEEDKKELDELKQQIEQAAEADKAKAATPVIEVTPEKPSPEPEPVKDPEPVSEEPTVTPNQSEPQGKDDPMEWARKKGLKTPEDMARLLRQKEQEYHQSRQKQAAPQQPPQQQQNWPPQQQQNWQPQPQLNEWGLPPTMPFYQPPVQVTPRQVANYYPQLAPEDVERLMPLVVDAAEVISNRKMAALEQRFGAQFGEIQRQTERNNEILQLSQDPAFHDQRVMQEMESAMNSDPSIFQRQGAYTMLFRKALENLARKQLQQGVSNGEPAKGNNPPVTAGGGNGSMNTVQEPVTEKLFLSWTDSEQKNYINSNGRIRPKK